MKFEKKTSICTARNVARSPGIPVPAPGSRPFGTPCSPVLAPSSERPES